MEQSFPAHEWFEIVCSHTTRVNKTRPANRRMFLARAQPVRFAGTFQPAAELLSPKNRFRWRKNSAGAQVAQNFAALVPEKT
jgi:hypothetical protein